MGSEAEGGRDQIFSRKWNYLHCSVKDGWGRKTGKGRLLHACGNEGGLSHHRSNGAGIAESYLGDGGILDQDTNEVPKQSWPRGNKGL